VNITKNELTREEALTPSSAIACIREGDMGSGPCVSHQKSRVVCQRSPKVKSSTSGDPVLMGDIKSLPSYLNYCCLYCEYNKNELTRDGDINSLCCI
jgi:hypothetical protein